MKKFLFLVVMGLSVMYIFAQDQHVNYKLPDGNQDLLFVFSEKNKDTAVVKVMIENAPRHFNAPGMPRFSIVGKDRKFYLGIGGYLRSTISYDIGNPIYSNCFFQTYNIPMNNLPGNKGLLQFGAQTSTININFVGLPGTKNQIGVYFSMNLTNNYAPVLQNAYGKYKGLIVGYTFSLFTDIMAGPPTIDFQGPNSWTAVSNAVVDYQRNFGKHWGIGVGIEMPMSSYTTSPNITTTVNQLVPDIPAYVQYAWNNRNSWLRLSGILRNMQYRDLVSNINRNSIAGGAKISGSAGIGKKIT
ncbi:MAG: hypothetical protein ACRC0A_01765, partial [Chitinophagaceae bacterium]